jgi:hypothetical protein
MHDIDRTQMEYSPEVSNFEGESYEFGEQEWSGESYGETVGETYGETVLTEAEEAELAGELLEVSNEAELDRFLGKLLSRAARAVGSAIRSPVGQAVPLAGHSAPRSAVASHRQPAMHSASKARPTSRKTASSKAQNSSCGSVLTP